MKDSEKTRKIKKVYWTLKECAEHLEMSPYTLNRHANRGTIPGRRLPGGWRFRIDEIEAWSEAKSNRYRNGSKVTRFQEARARLRSLKTESTLTSLSNQRKEVG